MFTYEWLDAFEYQTKIDVIVELVVTDSVTSTSIDFLLFA